MRVFLLWAVLLSMPVSADLLDFVEPLMPSDGTLQSLYLDEITRMENRGEIGDIVREKENQQLQQRTIPWFSWGMIGLSLLFFFVLPRFYGKGKTLINEWIRLSPKEKARREITRITTNRGEREEKYIAMVDLFRSYLEEEYGWQALEQTSTEFQGELMRRSDVERASLSHVSSLLRRADRLKFEKRSLTQKEWEEDREKLVHFFMTD